MDYYSTEIDFDSPFPAPRPSRNSALSVKSC